MPTVGRLFVVLLGVTDINKNKLYGSGMAMKYLLFENLIKKLVDGTYVYNHIITFNVL